MAIRQLLYLYDPMCGWCYGALPSIQGLAASGDWVVEPLPTGLFAGEPGRRIAPGMAAHIRQADARIAAMTGQPFSEAYQRHVLGNADLPLDSRPATEALTAVSQWKAPRELEALHTLQRERYVAGHDITDREVLARALAAALGEDTDAWRERLADPGLTARTAERTARAQHLMRSLGANGVPALVQPGDPASRLLPSQWLFNAQPLARQLATID